MLTSSLGIEKKQDQKFASQFFSGDNGKEVTPVPIPNTAVKLLCADGTARATKWESRTLPENLHINPDSEMNPGFFVSKFAPRQNGLGTLILQTFRVSQEMELYRSWITPHVGTEFPIHVPSKSELCRSCLTCHMECHPDKLKKNEGHEEKSLDGKVSQVSSVDDRTLTNRVSQVALERLEP